MTARVGVWPQNFSLAKFLAHNRCNSWLEARPQRDSYHYLVCALQSYMWLVCSTCSCQGTLQSSCPGRFSSLTMAWCFTYLPTILKPRHHLKYPLWSWGRLLLLWSSVWLALHELTCSPLWLSCVLYFLERCVYSTGTGIGKVVLKVPAIVTIYM